MQRHAHTHAQGYCSVSPTMLFKQCKLGRLPFRVERKHVVLMNAELVELVIQILTVHNTDLQREWKTCPETYPIHK